MPYINVDEAYILDNTGLQVDQVVDIPYTDAALTDGQKEQARKNISAGSTNHNLLDNPFFTKGSIVNQRGITTYACSGTEYNIDRWKSSSGNTITVADNGVTIVGSTGTHFNWSQPLAIGAYESVMGKTVTASVMTKSGNIYTKTFVAPNDIASGSLINIGVIQVTDGGVYSNIYITNKYSAISSNTYGFWLYSTGTALTVDLKAVKLELGTVSTLANDVPPDYGTELAKCRYYFERLKATGNYAVFGLGMATDTTHAAVLIPMSPKRVSTYTISKSGTLGVIGGSSVTSIAKDETASNSALNVYVTGTGFTANAIIILRAANDGSAYIDVSAEL